MKKIVADLHTHSIVSGHAYGTIREMAFEAKQKELKMLGISEHAPGIPGTVDPFYYENLEIIPRRIYDVEIVHGCEINVLNGGKISLGEEYFSQLDYAIIGIHRQCYENEGRVKNTQNMIECMKHDKIRFVSHPDDDHTPLDYKELVEAAKEYKVALEVNNSSLVKYKYRLNCVQNYEKMLELCMEYKVPIMVNSDAHDPSWVGEFTLAYKLLQDLNFDENLIVNNELDKLKSFVLHWD